MVAFFCLLAEHVDEAVADGVVEVGAKRALGRIAFFVGHPHGVNAFHIIFPLPIVNAELMHVVVDALFVLPENRLK